MIEKELYKQLKSTNNNSLIISGCKHFGKTTIIKNAFNHNKFPYNDINALFQHSKTICNIHNGIDI